LEKENEKLYEQLYRWYMHIMSFPVDKRLKYVSENFDIKISNPIVLSVFFSDIENIILFIKNETNLFKKLQFIRDISRYI
jgi:hypothetical protein